MADRLRAVVLGSVHMDLIARADRLPEPGASIGGGTFAMAPGGKAGNQAAALALAGAPTAVITRLGRDAFGRDLADALASRGVDVSAIVWDEARETGASTVLSARDEYMSIVAPGAAAALSAADLIAAGERLRAARLLVLQFELPPAVSLDAARTVKAAGGYVALNASPLAGRPEAAHTELIGAADALFMNRVEAGRLFPGLQPAGIAAATECTTVLVTAGANGADGCIDGEELRAPAFPAEVIDTVGAGDAFLGTFLTARLQGIAPGIALRRAACAGAIATESEGALAGLPTAVEVDARLASA